MLIVIRRVYCYVLQTESNKSINEATRDTHDLDEEMERVFAGVSSGADPNRFNVSRFTSDRSPRPVGRRFSEDDYTGEFRSISVDFGIFQSLESTCITYVVFTRLGLRLPFVSIQAGHYTPGVRRAAFPMFPIQFREIFIYLFRTSCMKSVPCRENVETSFKRIAQILNSKCFKRDVRFGKCLKNVIITRIAQRDIIFLSEKFT